MFKYTTTFHFTSSNEGMEEGVETIINEAETAFDAQVNALKLFFADAEMCNDEDEETAWDVAKQMVRALVPNIVIVNDLFCYYIDTFGDSLSENTIITTVRSPK